MHQAGSVLIGQLVDKYEPLNDREVRVLRRRDLYGSSLQFGDPSLIFHLDCNFALRYGVVQYMALFCYRPTRAEILAQTLRMFSDTCMMGHLNIQRFLYDYEVICNFDHHIFAQKRTR